MKRLYIPLMLVAVFVTAGMIGCKENSLKNPKGAM